MATKRHRLSLALAAAGLMVQKAGGVGSEATTSSLPADLGIDPDKYLAMSREQRRCYDLKGFYTSGNCFHYDGVVNGKPVASCPGNCTLWGNCLTTYPEVECQRARAAYQNWQDTRDNTDKTTS